MRFPVYSTNYNIFPMRKLSPREVEGSFYVTVSNSQKADRKEHQMDRLQGWLYLLQTFLLFFFSRGALGILESCCSCPTLQHKDCVWCSSFSSCVFCVFSELKGGVLGVDMASLFLRGLSKLPRQECLRDCSCQQMRIFKSALGPS